MLVGTYRENEVDDSHPLCSLREAILKSGNDEGEERKRQRQRNRDKGLRQSFPGTVDGSQQRRRVIFEEVLYCHRHSHSLSFTFSSDHVTRSIRSSCTGSWYLSALLVSSFSLLFSFLSQSLLCPFPCSAFCGHKLCLFFCSLSHMSRASVQSTLHMDKSSAAALSALIRQRTNGNPLYFTQCLKVTTEKEKMRVKKVTFYSVLCFSMTFSFYRFCMIVNCCGGTITQTNGSAISKQSTPVPLSGMRKPETDRRQRQTQRQTDNEKRENVS